VKPRTAVSLLLAIVAVCISATAALVLVDSPRADVSPARIASRDPYVAIPVDAAGSDRVVIVTETQAADRGMPILLAPGAFTVTPARVPAR
jgi:hypothetical protein